MLWGKNTQRQGISSDGTLSGHVDQWQELAVDYVDGRLDPPSEARVRAHLDGCSECRNRLKSQAHAFEAVHQLSLTDAPTGLEERVLSEVLFPTAPLHPRRSLQAKLSRASDAWWGTLRPWMPAAAAVVVVLAVVVTIGVVRQRDLPESGMAAESVTATAEAGAADGSAEESAILAADTTEGVDDATAREADDYLVLSAGPGSGDADQVDIDRMVNSLASADGPAYFAFADASDGSITLPQANAIAQQLNALTGLGPVDQTFSSGTRVFAAFVPTEDAHAVVDLLLSIGTSLDLTTILTMRPGQTVSQWAESLLENKYAVAELDASPSQPPSMSDWTYTTSTSPTTTSPTVAATTTASSEVASSTTASAGLVSTTTALPTTASPTTSSPPTTAPTTTGADSTTTTVSAPAPIKTHVLVVILVGVGN